MVAVAITDIDKYLKFFQSPLYGLRGEESIILSSTDLIL